MNPPDPLQHVQPSGWMDKTLPRPDADVLTPEELELIVGGISQPAVVDNGPGDQSAWRRASSANSPGCCISSS
jgi:hypothetical protein